MKCKRILVALLCLGLVLSLLSGCGNSSSNSSSASSSSSASGSASSSSAPATNDLPKRAAFVVSQAVGDEGPVDMVLGGIKANCEKHGFELTVVEAKAGEYEESLTAMAEDGVKLIFSEFPAMLDAVETVAANYPDCYFVHTLCNLEGHDNGMGIVGYEQQASFLVGVLAAMWTERDHIGFVGGVDNPDINRFLDGYKEGAKYINPNIKIDVVWTNDFEDVAVGKEMALTLYNNGCDVVWGSGGKVCLGYYEAVKEMGDGYYVIGCDTNHNHRANGQVLGSLVCYYEKWADFAFDAYLNGTFKGGNYITSMTTGHMDLVLNDESNGVTIPDDIKATIDDLRAKIMSGELKVECFPDVKLLPEPNN